jgi:hypothetical protein
VGFVLGAGVVVPEGFVDFAVVVCCHVSVVRRWVDCWAGALVVLS